MSIENNPIKTFYSLEEKQFSPYNLKDFHPQIFDEAFLWNIGVDIKKSSLTTLKKLEAGSLIFKKLFESKYLMPCKKYSVKKCLPHKLAVHNYTGMCPANVLEVSPSIGACSISCLYCLVSDGSQSSHITVFDNYPDILREELKQRKNDKIFFYFSPKVEAFSEPLLETGISHNILRVFIEHFKANPDSHVRIFIASKAGLKHLGFKSKGESIIDLLEKLSGKLQFNSSIGIMPDCIQDIFEPNAASSRDRLEALKMCQKKGVYAYSILVQPIVPCYLSEEIADRFLSTLKEYNVKNIKPEFLTTNIENIASIAQYIYYFDKRLLKDFLEVYLSKENQNHIKQRERIAPDRVFSLRGIKMLYKKAAERGISVSVCNWVKSQLNLQPDIESLSKELGFKCLGYQEKLFD